MCYWCFGSFQGHLFRMVPRGAFVLFACALSVGCSIGYRNHHESELLRLYRSDTEAGASEVPDANDRAHLYPDSEFSRTSDSTPDAGLDGSMVDPVDSSIDGSVDDIDPEWGTRVLKVYERDFDVPLSEVTPVRIYINCDRDSDEKSHFNRLTRSIVLKVGQAELPRIYVHEISHLFLNALESFPAYWIDQGLAEYMESRYVGNPDDPWVGLVAPGLDWSVPAVHHIGSHGDTGNHESGDHRPAAVLKERLTRDSIDEGRGWSVPFVHYLFEHRWHELPMPKKIRLLLEIDDQEIDILAPDFLEYCRQYNPMEELLEPR